MDILESLINNISRLPGIGKKSAKRIAFFLLNSDEAFNKSLAEEISSIKEKIKKCDICGAYTENTPCSICSNPIRDNGIICVVEQSQDTATIESTGEFKGKYHVLNGAISPLDGISPSDLRINELLARCHNENIEEVIVATNPTVEGDTTALYIVNLLKDLGIKVSRLASGIPIGGDIEYADKITLMRSLNGRIEY